MSSKVILIVALANLLLCYMGYSQNTEKERITISGNLNFETNVSPDVFIHLIESNSKKITKTETIKENNSFIFENVSKATYMLKIVDKDKTIYLGETFVAETNINLGTIQVNSSNTILDEVVVTKSKPYIERQQGKMILNVDSNIGSTGSSAFEVLEKAPGVNVDNNDNISLRGRTGLLIQIDGKPTPMTGSSLANFLRGIPSGNIDKIEFITNPSAKYDAAGSSIINIKMKKDKKIGVNGSISSSYGQGIYAKNNNNMSLNYRDKKVNLFGNYSFVYREGFNELLLNRQFYDGENFLGAFDQNNFLRMNFRNHIGRIGADFFINKKHTLGIVMNKVSNKFNPTGNNSSDVYDETNTKSSRFETQNRSRDNWYNQSVNVNHKFTIDTLGTELTTDFDYANFGNKTKQNFTTRYFDLNNNEFQNPYLLYGNIKGDLNIFALKSDFVTNFKNKLKLETGIKSSYVKADNNLMFYDVSSGNPVFDPTKSNHFIYEENINAAYFTFSKEFKKWSFYAGLRMENTNIIGKQLVDNTSFRNSYVQLFPNAVFSYTLNDNNSLELNYSRRITRPSYDQLNPFKFFLDPTTYKEGNPYLKPQSTHSVELTHAFKQKFITTLSASRTTDNITEVIAPSDENQQLTIQTSKNLNTADIVGLFSIIPFELTKWWNSSNSLNFYFGSYSGTIANTTINNQGNFTYNFNSTNTFKLGKGYTAELTGNYRAREIYAFMDVEPIWFINIGLQKKFRNNSVLRLAVNDIFYTNRTTAFTEFTGYKEDFRVARDTRVATISYTYNFGKNNTPQRRRASGADDIKQRASSSNG
jgi:outer membrane receptor protein involved in Fe transport